jgi:glycosyltransferase involved in cell wall biosynthesis
MKSGRLGFSHTGKTRVLFVVNTVEFGGLEKHLLDLVRRLPDSTIECIILCYGPDFYTQRPGDLPGAWVVTRLWEKCRNFRSYCVAFAKLKPSVIVFVKGCLDSYPLKAYVAARLSGSRRVLAMEQLIADEVPQRTRGKRENYLRQIFGWRARHIARYVWAKRLAGTLIDQTICISNSVRNRLVNDYGFPAAKTVTIPNGIDLRSFDSPNGNRRQSLRKGMGITE